MDEHDEQPSCDFEGCDNDADQLMVVDDRPVAILCPGCMDRVHEATDAETHKVGLDIHLHRHSIVTLVDQREALGQMYMQEQAQVN